MLLFSTLLPIRPTMTPDLFIQEVLDWNQGTPYEVNRIPNIEWHGERNIRFGNEKLWLQIEEYRNRNIIAVRFEKTEESGVIWDTDYVMNFDEMKMSVRLDRGYLEEAYAVDPAFSAPAFIALLIDHGFLQDDGDLPVGRKPVFIAEDNLQLAADVINGTAGYRLPVVYVSHPFSDEESLDVRDIAKRLKGVAHVLVQENPWSGVTLRNLTDSKNEFNGAVGIYFPDRTGSHLTYLRRDYPGSDTALANKVVKRVLEYSTSRRMGVLYTWAGVNNALLRDRYSVKREELAASESARQASESTARARTYEVALMRREVEDNRKSAEESRKLAEESRKSAEDSRRIAEEKSKIAEENRELVESVDEEIQEMRREIEALTRQNDALTYENLGLHARLDGMSQSPVLYLGSEEEFFPDEIKEFILGAVQKELKATKEKTRKADVLSDILLSNGGFQDLASKRGEKLKSILRGYRNLSGVQKRDLETLGFTITKDGGHYKLRYRDDGRYMVTLAATPSDNRSGDNTALEIIRDMF